MHKFYKNHEKPRVCKRPLIFLVLTFFLVFCFIPETVLASDVSEESYEYLDSSESLNDSVSSESLDDTALDDTSNDSSESSYVYGSTVETYGDVIIDDEAALISDKESVKESMSSFTTYGKACFVSTYSGYENADEIESVYDEYIGYQEDGFLLLIDMSSRKILIYTDGNVYNRINENYANTIADNIYKSASSGNYDAVIEEAFKEATNLMAGQKIAQPMRIITSALMAIAFALLICFLIAQAAAGNFSTSHTEFSMNGVKILNKRRTFLRTEHIYSPRESGGSSGGSSGGGSSGGGHSGGGGGHSF